MSGALTSRLVARQFLDMADPDHPTLTPLKLTKMTFIAHGWHLGLHKESLIDEDVHAWKHGPVFPDLHEVIKAYEGSRVVEVAKSEQEKIDPPRDLKPHEVQVIVELNRAYGHLTGEELSEMTHMEGSPWDVTSKRHGGVETKPVIARDLIRDHYARLLDC